MLNNITIMPSLMDYNIHLKCDYLYAMQVVVSSIYRIMTFPHEGRVIIFDKLSYHDHPSHTSHNKTTPSMAYVESMHYVFTTSISVDRIQKSVSL